MSVDLKIKKTIMVNRRFKLSAETNDLLDRYIQAAKEDDPGVEGDQVIEAVLLHHFAKDRSFKRWLKEQKKGLQPTAGEGPVEEAKTGPLNDSQKT